MKTEILYEDGDILVVRKAAGLATQTARAGQQDVISELKNHLEENLELTEVSEKRRLPYLGVIHRLDQPVEGLLVFGKNRRAAADLTRQLQTKEEGGTFSKQYYAVICGNPADAEGELTDYLYKKEGNRAAVTAEGEHPGARRAVLRYTILKRRPEEGLALADIQIDTGRFHQIRAQMAHAGMPILGDSKYGNEKSRELARSLGIQNVALCAYCLEFMHPDSKKEMKFQIRPHGRAFSFFSQL